MKFKIAYFEILRDGWEKVHFFVVRQSILFIIMDINLQNFEFSFAGKINKILINFSTNKKLFKFKIAKLESHIDGCQ